MTHALLVHCTSSAYAQQHLNASYKAFKTPNVQYCTLLGEGDRCHDRLVERGEKKNLVIRPHNYYYVLHPI